jgi:hypothetical protein
MPPLYFLIGDVAQTPAFYPWVDVLSHKYETLFIAREPHDKIGKAVGLKVFPKVSKFLWLTKADKENAIRPDELDAFCNIILEHLKVEPNRAVVIDGLEYLVSVNGFDKMLRTLNVLRDYAIDSEGFVVVQVYPSNYSGIELARLERLAPFNHPVWIVG